MSRSRRSRPQSRQRGARSSSSSACTAAARPPLPRRWRRSASTCPARRPPRRRDGNEFRALREPVAPRRVRRRSPPPRRRLGRPARRTAIPPRSDELAALVARARTSVRRTFPGPEPRRLLEGPASVAAAAVLAPGDRPAARRRPVPSPPSRGRSIARRSRRRRPPLGLALWERYTRSAVSGLAGIPVFVSEYYDALADEAELARRDDRVARVARIVSPSEQSTNHDRVLLFDARLQHFRAGQRCHDPASPALLQPQTALFDELVERAAAVMQLQLPHGASTESAWTTQSSSSAATSTRIWRGMEWLSQELAGHVPLAAARREARRVRLRHLAGHRRHRGRDRDTTPGSSTRASRLACRLDRRPT